MRLFSCGNGLVALLLAVGPAMAGEPKASAETSLLAAPGGARSFDYVEGGVFAVIATPGRITDIQLEPGEALVGSGAVAAGDTVRWVIGDTISGPADQRRVHVMIKPTEAGLATNLIVNSDRRTYHLELRASARTWFSQVSWRYPVRVVPAAPAPAPGSGLRAQASQPPSRLNLSYQILGPHPAWRPQRVYDDGRRAYVEFGPRAAMSDLPPLYLTAPDGTSVELLNYHVEGRRLVVDRLLDRAELRLGGRRHAARVRILRLAPEAGAGR